MEDFYKFMDERIKNTMRRGTNCVGTALYIVGERDFEATLQRRDSRKLLLRMRNSLRPEVGYLVLWESEGIPFHAGVIYKENPFEIVHRSESKEILTPMRLDKFNKYIFEKTGLKPIYKIPNKLREQKEQEKQNPHL